jgi:outer membrane protein
MSTAKLLPALAALLLASAGAAGAHAADFQPKAKGTFIVDLRVSDVAPDANDAIRTGPGGEGPAGVDTGMHVSITDSVMPTLGFTYFFTDHFAVDLTVGTTQHTIKAKGAGVDLKVADTWVLPPVIALQYHFMPKSRFSPYVGIGPNFMLYYGGKNYNGLQTHVSDSVGFATQFGADYAIAGPWAANLDVKKVFVESDAKINGGALVSNVNLDPWVISIGVGRRF